MENPETYYAIAPDGVYLAYQTLGDGPTSCGSPSGPGTSTSNGTRPPPGPLLRELATFSRVITHDQRGIGLSSRNVALPDLETRVMDLRAVLDSAGADRVVLLGSIHTREASTRCWPQQIRHECIPWSGSNLHHARMWSPYYPWGVGADYHEAEPGGARRTGERSDYGPRFRSSTRLRSGTRSPSSGAEAHVETEPQRVLAGHREGDCRRSGMPPTCGRSSRPSGAPPSCLSRGGAGDSGEPKYIASLMPSAEARLDSPLGRLERRSN